MDGPENDWLHPGDKMTSQDVIHLREDCGAGLLNTKSPHGVIGMIFVASDRSKTLNSAYPGQFLFRIDKIRSCAYIDVCEFVPEPQLKYPSKDNMSEIYAKYLAFEPRRANWFAEEEEETIEPLFDQSRDEAELKSPESDFILLQYAKFCTSRILRIKIGFDNISGIALVRLNSPNRSPSDEEYDSEDFDEDEEYDDNHPAVLVLELKKRLRQSAYATRCLNSSITIDNVYVPYTDWTPDQIASTSSPFTSFIRIALKLSPP
eukprot:TRINITY_DN8042_c0_g1_i1.p1 TRINITY_DN8042_c0_g1~~TRINITY_DN8042_c0_g1_i1.p1  ORF type:complete len:308 (-),score=60.03 TRINITY_DN8042_c0_g1_i1:1291-2076(-)